MLIPVNFDGSFDSAALSKIRTDFRRYPHTNGSAKSLLVVCGFGQMSSTAKFIFNNGVSPNVKFRQTSALDPLPIQISDNPIFTQRLHRSEKELLTSVVSFSPEKLDEEIKKIFAEAETQPVVVFAHRLAAEYFLLVYKKMHPEMNLPFFIPGSGDTLFFKDGTFDYKRYYGASRIPNKKRMTDDHID